MGPAARFSPDVTRRRRGAALLALAAVAVAIVAVIASALASGDDASPNKGAEAKAAATPPPPPTLPDGSRRVFPDHRVVGFYGNPKADELGELGIGPPSKVARKLRRQARGYNRRSRPVLPAFELISTIADADPGPSGKYRSRMPDGMIRRYLRAARKAKAILILDIQPGHSDFFEETIRLEKWLREPDVHLALDPEWRMLGGEKPGTVIGSVTARELNATTAWLDMLVAKHNLPQKLVVIHQFTLDMIQNRPRLKQREHLAITLNADGFGDQPNKLSKYRAFTRGQKKFANGYKLFYREDINLMTPKEVMRMRPRPDFIVYE
ncbi:MAG TPA: hypothetical protein VF533_02305 [Solirubrobacteraceae bacterium]|jgi:hypothetical protein